MTDILIAFCVGGLLCLTGEIIISLTALTPAKILVGYVVGGVFLSAVGIYGKLVDFAKCGATVPLTGFGYQIAKGTKEAVESYGLLGALSGGITATAAGISAAVFFSLIASFIFISKDKS